MKKNMLHTSKICFICLIIGLMGGVVHGETRGIKNNNPGNIVKNNIQWKGCTGNDGKFVKFINAEYGIRAMARNLKTYQNKYGLNTIETILNRWAPNNENNTSKYVSFVSQKMGIKSNQKLDLNNNEQLYKLIDAMIIFENGKNPYNAETMNNGIKLS